ncbi:YIP1 family protein [Sinimarinibacterium sp. CAU 1509]|uniref:Yip1 family protein n=1 Tax=Sinimarinibacterium sp. CAU 1509 TaxID=2562283 RepID=UPI0010ABBE7E|nr:Yip1 family protein [Sinimarinibacterium sp. CAU 1509]TJY61067.1 YIP1 family protein [Sinimarinibacterium sp. CAU 1509]
MKLTERALAIVLSPRNTWPQIEEESASVGAIYREYLLILAAIPAVCGFIGTSIVGVSVFGVSARVPVLSGLVGMVVSYALSLAGVFVLSLIVNALAPKFGGQSDALKAFKLVAYAATASMFGGVFSIIPALSLLGVLAGLYSLVLLYRGLPVLMKNPAEKSLAYTAVIIVCAVVLGLVMGAVTSIFAPSAGIGLQASKRGADSTGFRIETPAGTLALDPDRIETAKQRMLEASKRMEQASSRNDGAAMADAANDSMAAAITAMGGDAAVGPVPAKTLKTMLPDRIGDFRRVSSQASDGAAMGSAMSEVHARYTHDAATADIEIVDMGSAATLISMATAMQAGEYEDDTSVRSTRRDGGRTTVLNYQRDGSSAEARITLSNGIVVTVSAQQAGIDAVKQLVDGLDLDRLEKSERPRAG